MRVSAPSNSATNRLSRTGTICRRRRLNNPDFALVDLFGDGLPDVLHSSPAGFRYWRNLGGGRLDRPRVMPQVPAGIALSQPGVGFGDMGGDGQADLLVHSGPLAGFLRDHLRRNLADVQAAMTYFPRSTWPIRTCDWSISPETASRMR